MIGDLSISLNIILTPFWIWLESLVILVISVALPATSVSALESDMICLKRSLRSSVPTPTAVFALKYCAVIAKKRPAIPKPSSIRPLVYIYILS